MAASESRETSNPDGIEGGTIDNRLVDVLASRIEETVVIKDVAVQTPNMIWVTKGYRMTDEGKPIDHFMARSDVKAHVKRKKDDGILPKPLGHRNEIETYGFNPQEVNMRGAVCMKNCRSSTLTNDIHPFFSRCRFDDTPDVIYDEIIPALRLASMFLTQPVCMHFWVTLALAKRQDDPQMSLKYGRSCQRIDRQVPLTDTNTATVIKRLEDLGRANLVHFAFRHKNSMPAKDVWGCSQPIKMYCGGRSKALTRSIIKLHADHYIVAQKLSKLKYPERSQQLRFYFLFAVLLLHELAHSVDGAYIQMRHDEWLSFQQTRQCLEPFFFDWERPPESGRTMEQVIFGGEIQPINMRIDGSHGICISDWPPSASLEDSQRRVWYTVPTSYIERLFQMETWRQQRHRNDAKVLHIPRSGAVSLYIWSFTTMAWSEEQRVADEEAAESLAIAKAQPPPKTRLVFTGEPEEQRTQDEAIAEATMDEAYAEKFEIAQVYRQSSSSLDTPHELAEHPTPSNAVDKSPASKVRSIVDAEAGETLKITNSSPSPFSKDVTMKDKRLDSDRKKNASKRPLGIWETRKRRKILIAE